MGRALELAVAGGSNRTHLGGDTRTSRPVGDARTDRGLPRACAERAASRNFHEEAPEGQARAGRGAGSWPEKGAIGYSEAAQGNPREAEEIPSPPPGLHVVHRHPRGTPTGSTQ